MKKCGLQQVVDRLCHCSKSWKRSDKSGTLAVVSLSFIREGQTVLKRNLLPVAQANGKDRECYQVFVELTLCAGQIQFGLCPKLKRVTACCHRSENGLRAVANLELRSREAVAACTSARLAAAARLEDLSSRLGEAMIASGRELLAVADLEMEAASQAKASPLGAETEVRSFAWLLFSYPNAIRQRREIKSHYDCVQAYHPRGGQGRHGHTRQEL